MIEVSFVLIDWSCRESAHTVDYLNKQTIARERYEILWIEYYGRRFDEIEKRLTDSRSNGRHPAVDQWLVMDMPKASYYHKHLAYNIGILSAKGKIVCIMDSDAAVRPNFVETIIGEFARNDQIVLHYDEVRNYSHKYYPFNYPSLDEVEVGAGNVKNGKPFGLVATDDFLHNRNYGACFCARREDLIAIGGADEHIDYLGHVCGPYEMTFRLVNAGKTEIWHPTSWLYHVWHPGQAGDNNYVGPHDGTMMSTTAMDVIKSGRVRPLVENEYIARLQKSPNGTLDEDFDAVMAAIRSSSRAQNWVIDLSQLVTTTFPSGNRKIEVYSSVGNTEARRLQARRLNLSARRALALGYRTANMLIGRGAHRSPAQDAKALAFAVGIVPGGQVWRLLARARQKLGGYG